MRVWSMKFSLVRIAVVLAVVIPVFIGALTPTKIVCGFSHRFTFQNLTNSDTSIMIWNKDPEKVLMRVDVPIGATSYMIVLALDDFPNAHDFRFPQDAGFTVNIHARNGSIIRSFQRGPNIFSQRENSYDWQFVISNENVVQVWNQLEPDHYTNSEIVMSPSRTDFENQATLSADLTIDETVKHIH